MRKRKVGATPNHRLYKKFKGDESVRAAHRQRTDKHRSFTVMFVQALTAMAHDPHAKWPPMTQREIELARARGWQLTTDVNGGVHLDIEKMPDIPPNGGERPQAEA